MPTQGMPNVFTKELVGLQKLYYNIIEKYAFSQFIQAISIMWQPLLEDDFDFIIPSLTLDFDQEIVWGIDLIFTAIERTSSLHYSLQVFLPLLLI